MIPPATLWRRAVVLAVLGACLLAGWGGLLAGRVVLFFGDIGLYFAPLLDVQRRELLHGRIALWDPYVLCGRPLAGNPQAWPLYPSSWWLAVLPSAEIAAGVIGALHLLWAALGTYVFARRRGLRAGAALVGVVAWGFGGALVSKLQFPNMAQAASWLPWLLWAAERIVPPPPAPPPRGAGEGQGVGAIALVVALMLLAAHPQVFLMAFYLAAAWLLWRAVALPPGRRFRPVLLAAGALALGIGIAAAQLLPTVELARVSVRPELTLAKANRFILPPYAALTAFVAPNFYGNPATPGDPYLARGNFWEPCAYLGLLPLALALGAAGRLWRTRPEVRFWTIAAGLCVWLALGKDAGLFAVAFRALPGLNKFHDAARWLLPGTFALALLAAHGADALLATVRAADRRTWLSAALVGLTAADVIAFSRTLNPVAPPKVYAGARRGFGGEGRLFHADEGRVWARYVSYRSYDVVAGTRAAAFLASGGPNLPALAGRGSLGGYEPVARADSAALAADARRLSALPLGRPLPPGLVALLRDAGVSAVARLGPEGTPRLEPLPGGAGARARLRRSDGRPDLPLPVRDETTQRVAVDLPPGHGGGTLVLADTLHPGWRATVDGSPTPIDHPPGRGPFRAVGVPPAARRVIFFFEPDSWRVGTFISLCSLGILVAVSAAHAARGRPPAPGAPAGGTSVRPALPDVTTR